jgi:superfamily II DNA or RNA helicase
MKITLTHQAKIEALGSVIQQIEKNCTFKNPKFAEAIHYHRSTRGIDQLINLSTRNDDSLSIPLGLVKQIWRQYGAQIDDQRHQHLARIASTIETRPYQERAVRAAVTEGGGVIVAPTGSGKTTMGIEIAARLGQRCLILVKSKDLAKQWIGAIKKFTGLDAGMIGDGKWNEGEQFTVATVQTLVKHEGSLDYGLLIVDECHNVPAEQAYTVINRQAARYRFGLSATPQRRDNLEFMIHAALGPIVAEIEQHEVEGAVLPVVVSTIYHSFQGDPQSWTEFNQALSHDPERNRLIVNSAIKCSRSTGTAVLTSTIEHAERLHHDIKQHGAEALLLHGQLPAKLRAEHMRTAADARLIIGTLSLLSEGIDWPHVGAIVFAAPVSAEVNRENPAATRLLQSIGRARRPFPGKQYAFVLDIIDRHPFGLSAGRKRGKIYRQQGFDVRILERAA